MQEEVVRKDILKTQTENKGALLSQASSEVASVCNIGTTGSAVSQLQQLCSLLVLGSFYLRTYVLSKYSAASVVSFKIKKKLEKMT